jgi:ParB family transcriptional regulator, chromosome partitioning protein
MATVKKIVLSGSRDIPFCKLILSQANVRHVKAGVSIEELADDIARRTLLQSLTVRAVRDPDGAETGMFEIPAGGRRYRALELLVKRKVLAKTAPVPCVVRTDGLAEEDSLAENVQRAPLHPLDQFRAFQAMREKGMDEDEIAAAFFVSPGIVKQRLKLASVAPALLDAYAEDAMTLDQLMAFTVNPDHERQSQVWEALQRSYSKQPYEVRRLLTEGAVRASDKRAQFVGIDAYVEAGGTVMRDLFQSDEGGWLNDARMLDRMVDERLAEAVEGIRAEGWKWVEAAAEFPYGHNYAMRRLRGEQAPLTDEEQATRDALQAEHETIDAEWLGGADLSEEVDQRLEEIETALAALDGRPVQYDPAEIAIAGVFVGLDGSGALRIQRGYVRPEDEPPVERPSDDVGADTVEGIAEQPVATGTEAAVEPEEEDGIKPLPDRLLGELTAYRTLALRHAVGGDAGVGFLVALHALCLRRFYVYAQDSCLELELKSTTLGAHVAGLADTALAREIDERHEAWAAQLPKEPEDLWDWLTPLETSRMLRLFAHCVSFGLNAVYEPYNRRPRALAHADRISRDVKLDLAASWTPTAASYFGRVTKARIVLAVEEGRGKAIALSLDGLKKVEMAERAEQLLADTGWLPDPLRTPGQYGVKTDIADEPVSDRGPLPDADELAYDGEPLLLAIAAE